MSINKPFSSIQDLECSYPIRFPKAVLNYIGEREIETDLQDLVGSSNLLLSELARIAIQAGKTKITTSVPVFGSTDMSMNWSSTDIGQAFRDTIAATINEKLTAVEDTLSEFDWDKYNEMDRENNLLSDQVEQYSTVIKELNISLKEAEHTIKDTCDELKAAREKIDEMTDEISHLNKLHDECLKRINDLETQVEDLESKKGAEP
jgi:chromosome segregation ATPase